MHLTVNRMFEQLIEGKTLTLVLDSEAVYESIYGQLRVAKSRNNKRFTALFAEPLVPSDVIKGTWNNESKKATFTLAKSTKKAMIWEVEIDIES